MYILTSQTKKSDAIRLWLITGMVCHTQAQRHTPATATTQHHQKQKLNMNDCKQFVCKSLVAYCWFYNTAAIDYAHKLLSSMDMKDCF